MNMIRRTRLLPFVSFLLLLVPIASQAQGSGSVINAATCQRTDVNAVINGPTHVAKNGDTIQIPAGTCTWTSGITISGVGFTIVGTGTPNTLPSQFGAGTSSTILIDSASGPLFRVIGLTFGQTMRISMLNVQPVSGAAANSVTAGIAFVGVCSTSGCPSIRADNITFPVSWDGPLSGGLFITNNVFGVLDHNTATGAGGVGPPLVQVSHSAWQGVGDNGDNSFAAADSFGTAQALYIENNLLAAVRGTENDVGDSGIGGNRAVCRYNNINPQAGSGVCSSHGTSWGGRPRGVRQIEVYRNIVACPLCGSGTGVLSGTGLFFENNWSGSWNKLVSLDVPRTWHSISPWKYCDGASPYDENDGTTYSSGSVTSGGTSTFSDSSKTCRTNRWAGCAMTSGTPYSVHNVTRNAGSDILSNTANQYSFAAALYFNWAAADSYQILRARVCLDQPGRGPGALLQGATPVLVSTGSPGPVNQVPDPIYEWGDTHSGGGGTPIVSASPRLLSNRDFYNENANQSAQTSTTSPFNGASGTGHGILANRPSTCTAGVAYWATDQGNWNQSGSGSQGQLYVCSATNTWTLKYTPYTYPHPLVTGASTGGGSLNPPSNLAAIIQ